MAPLHVDDGKFSESHQIRDWEYERPFVKEGDARTFIARRLMRVESPYFLKTNLVGGGAARSGGNGASRGSGGSSASPFMSRRVFGSSGYAYLVDTTPARAVDGQSRIVEYEEIWASVPIARTVYQQVSYTAQPAWYATSGEPTIVEFTDSYNGTVLWEYALRPLPLRNAPRLEIIEGVLYNRGEKWTANMRNPIAEDSVNDIYMGRIYFRKTIRVQLPSYSTIVVV